VEKDAVTWWIDRRRRGRNEAPDRQPQRCTDSGTDYNHGVSRGSSGTENALFRGERGERWGEASAFPLNVTLAEAAKVEEFFHKADTKRGYNLKMGSKKKKREVL